MMEILVFTKSVFFGGENLFYKVVAILYKYNNNNVLYKEYILLD